MRGREGEASPRSASRAVGNSPEEFAAQIKRELPKWAKVVREGNIKAE